VRVAKKFDDIFEESLFGEDYDLKVAISLEKG
jgi:hypothetical protein